MKLVIDRKIYEEGGEELFIQLQQWLGDNKRSAALSIVTAPSFDDCQSLLHQVNALIFRSNFNANQNTLVGCDNISFVASASAGKDNLDVAYLESRNISWAHAPGCNADAVADYVLSCLALTDNLEALCHEVKSIGLVGCGEVGSRIYTRLSRLAKLVEKNCKIRVYDPFIETIKFLSPASSISGIDSAPATANFSDFDAVLQCDILVLACSLTTTPANKASYGLFDESVLSRLSANQLLINCARGEVIDEQALLKILGDSKGKDKKNGGRKPPQLIMDVWPNEPVTNKELVISCLIATPHIAGYSKLGKATASARVFEQFCAHFFPGYQLKFFEEQSTRLLAPQPNQDEQLLDYAKRLLLENYDPMKDSLQMKNVFTNNPLYAQYKETVFQSMRNDYPLRRQGTQWDCSELPDFPASPDNYRRVAQAVLGQ